MMTKRLQKNLIMTGAATVVALAAASPAQALLLDFNAEPLRTFSGDTFVEDGFRFESTEGHYDIFGGGTGGSPFLNLDTVSTGPVSTVRLDFFGNLFDLNSFDLIDAAGSISSSAGGFFDLSAAALGTQTFSGSAWSDLTYVEFSTNGGFLGVDSIDVAPVPTPAAVLPVLTGLFATARRKKSSEI